MEKERVNEVIGKIKVTGKSFSLHRHDSCEIITLVSGNATLNCEREKYAVNSGEVVIIPSNCLHYFSGESEFEYYYLSGIDTPYFIVTAPQILRLGDRKSEAQTLMNLIYLNRYSNNKNYLHSLIESLTLLLADNMDYASVLDNAVNSVILQISRNFSSSQLSVSELLNKTGYAEDYIRARFREITGKTPNEFLTQMRIQHAQKLIGAFNKSIPLGEVAVLCGYNDYAYFSRKFRSVVGVCPSKYTKDF
jgi:AraC-like DNA-binding protein